MKHHDRIRRLEVQCQPDWAALSDEELEQMAEGIDPDVVAAIQAMTDAELVALMAARPADVAKIMAAAIAKRLVEE